MRITRTTWRYPARLLRVVDGDTLDLEVVLSSRWHSDPIWGHQNPITHRQPEGGEPVEIDLGFNSFEVYRREPGGIYVEERVFRDRFRLLGIDTPEVYGVKAEDRGPGEAASAWVKEALDGAQIEVETFKGQGKYGRWLATVWATRPGEAPPADSINALLVQAGHAVNREY